MTPGTVEARVNRGVALLDKQIPGWWRCIDLDILDMGSGRSDVLGQLFAGSQDLADVTPYELGAATLFDLDIASIAVLLSPEPGLHGFTGVPEQENKQAAHDELTAIWKRVILARRDGHEPVTPERLASWRDMAAHEDERIGLALLDACNEIELLHAAFRALEADRARTCTAFDTYVRTHIDKGGCQPPDEDGGAGC